MTAEPAPSLRLRLGLRLSRAVALAGPLRRLALETAAWSLLMAASAVISLLIVGWEDEAHIRQVALLYCVSGLLGYPPSVVAAAFACDGQRLETRFAAHVLLIAAGTVGVAALINGLWLRAYFAEWHAALFSVEWAFQFVFTVGGGVYQFALFGLRLFLPFGFLALMVFSALRSLRMR